MKAILISEDNLPKIIQAGAPHDRVEYSYKTYIGSTQNWYAIVDYIGPKGGYQAWAVLPEYVFTENFIHDLETLKTDWDTIYRLA